MSTTVPPTATPSRRHPAIPYPAGPTPGLWAAASTRRLATSPRSSSPSLRHAESSGSRGRPSDPPPLGIPTDSRRSCRRPPLWPPQPKAPATISCGGPPVACTAWSPAACSTRRRWNAPSVTPPSNLACYARSPKQPSGPSSPPARSACPSRGGSHCLLAVVRSRASRPDPRPPTTTGPPWSTNNPNRPEQPSLTNEERYEIRGCPAELAGFGCHGQAECLDDGAEVLGEGEAILVGRHP